MTPADNNPTNNELPMEITKDILNVEEAASLLGVSVKTFNKVLHAEDMPARKIGREWKFSRTALIEWVGSGRARDFYREAHTVTHDTVTPIPRRRRTGGWRIEMD
jgi:excisionase family DNA binding protein